MDGLKFRMAGPEDAQLYYDWANDEVVRKNSYQQKNIPYNDHLAWFKRKLGDKTCHFYLFSVGDDYAGQVRIDEVNREIIIGISLDQQYRGKGLSAKMLTMACTAYKNEYPNSEIVAYIKQENISSYRTFLKAGFYNESRVMIDSNLSFRLTI